MFRITREWIHAHKSAAGGWTRKQLEAIGVKWPPKRGWVGRAEGWYVSEENRRIFETGAKSYPSGIPDGYINTGYSEFDTESRSHLSAITMGLYLSTERMTKGGVDDVREQ